MNEEALRRVLARLKAQGWAVATQDLPSEPNPRIDQGPRQPSLDPECEAGREPLSHFRLAEGRAPRPATELGRLADLDTEEALFRVWWRTLPDLALARKTWRSTLRWYCQEKSLGPETLEALQQRVQDLWETP